MRLFSIFFTRKMSCSICRITCLNVLWRWTEKALEKSLIDSSRNSRLSIEERTITTNSKQQNQQYILALNF